MAFEVANSSHPAAVFFKLHFTVGQNLYESANEIDKLLLQNHMPDSFTMTSQIRPSYSISRLAVGMRRRRLSKSEKTDISSPSNHLPPSRGNRDLSVVADDPRRNHFVNESADETLKTPKPGWISSLSGWRWMPVRAVNYQDNGSCSAASPLAPNAIGHAIESESLTKQHDTILPPEVTTEDCEGELEPTIDSGSLNNVLSQSDHEGKLILPHTCTLNFDEDSMESCSPCPSAEALPTFTSLPKADCLDLKDRPETPCTGSASSEDDCLLRNSAASQISQQLLQQNSEIDGLMILDLEKQEHQHTRYSTSAVSLPLPSTRLTPPRPFLSTAVVGVASSNQRSRSAVSNRCRDENNDDSVRSAAIVDAEETIAQIASILSQFSVSEGHRIIFSEPTLTTLDAPKSTEQQSFHHEVIRGGETGSTAAAALGVVKTTHHADETAQPAGGDNSSASECQQLPQKYVLMLKSGVPEQAVLEKAVADVEALFGVSVRVSSRQYLSSPVAGSEGVDGDDLSSTPDRGPASSSPADEKAAVKYRGMLKAGVPAGAVRHKMVQDGVDPKMIKMVFEPAAASQAVAPESLTAAISTESHVTHGEASPVVVENKEDEVLLSKYRRMLKAGVPVGAVRHKMSAEGLSQELINLVFGEDAGSQQDQPVISNTTDMQAAEKYRSMLKAGVPVLAVKHKMVKDCVDQKVIDELCSASDSGSGEIGGAKVKPVQNQMQASKLMTLHWTPLGLSKEQLSRSVWAQREPTAETPSRTPLLQPAEIARLESLFSKKQASTKKALSASDEGGGRKERSVTGKVQKKSALDTARTQNLAIGLRSFKESMTPAEIGPAVNFLRSEKFSTEQLTRLGEMLPTDDEVNAVKRFSTVQAKIKAINSAPSPGLEPAEVFVLSFECTPRARNKLAVLTLMKTLGSVVNELMSSFRTLLGACGQVSESKKLVQLLAKVLAVGNVMNEGTSKGGAKGITVDSLLKLTQTKSVCKTLTVLDYIVDSLVSSGGMDAVSSSLEFSADIPDLENAARLPIGELSGQVQQLRQALIQATRELEKLRGEELVGGEPKPEGTTQKVDVSSRSAATSAHKGGAEDPKEILMAMLRARAAPGQSDVAQTPPVKSRADKPRINIGEKSQEELGKVVPQRSAPAMKSAQKDEAGDTREGLMAMLRARADPLSEPTNPPEISPPQLSETYGPVEKKSIPDPNHQEEPQQAIESLSAFVTSSEMLLEEAEHELGKVRGRLEELAEFFGESGQDPGYIFECLRSFAAMVKEATTKAQRRIQKESLKKGKHSPK